jgi:hypothetical protein
MASVPPSAAGALEGMATRATRAQRWVRSPSSGELELKASVGGRERAFQMRSVLVQDKHDTTIMLGILLEQDPEAPHAWRAVQGAPEVVLKVGHARGCGSAGCCSIAHAPARAPMR